jgi:VRR-NUC domain-containing protein
MKRSAYATEAQEQRTLIQWSKKVRIGLDGLFIYDFLVVGAAGGSRHFFEACNLKLSGIQKGIPDLFLAYPCGKYAGLWIELKRKNGKSTISKAQQEWLEKFTQVGYKCAVCYGFDAAREMITEYLNPRRDNHF